MQSAAAQSTSLTITNPLVLYRALLATQRIQPDEAQHRLAIHLQKLYHRLKDYSPETSYRDRLDRLASTLQSPSSSAGASSSSSSSTFSAETFPTQQTSKGNDHEVPLSSFLSRLRAQRAQASSLALTRQLTRHEATLQMQSPRGLLLHGDVGTGKSMLVDLLSESLPTARKRRWHFNAFMLETFARLERLRRAAQLGPDRRGRRKGEDGSDGDETLGTAQSASLVLLAKGLVEESPVVFLDEFQLPDRAAAKILTSLFTAFFRLGGVLVATSNRLPEELAKASGVEFASPPAGEGGLWGRGRRALGLASGPVGTGGRFDGQSSDFAAFLDVLRARCEIWDMNGLRDWRRVEVGSRKGSTAVAANQDTKFYAGSLDGTDAAPTTTPGHELAESQDAGYAPISENVDEADIIPIHYHINPLPPLSNLQRAGKGDLEWQSAVLDAVSSPSFRPRKIESIAWKAQSLRVYGRDLHVSHSFAGVTIWSFLALCGANLGPADYISLASTFHTFILTDVPVLSLLQRNEARRFITLLDALYEARCKLLIRAEAGPDGLFFPEAKALTPSSSTSGAAATGPTPAIAEDGTYPETFSEIYQDRTSPFRPNVSSYTPSASSPTYASTPLPSLSNPNPSTRSILADEDSDFGPVYGAGRSSAASSPLSPKHRPRGASDGLPGAGHEIGHSGLEQGDAAAAAAAGSVDFQRTGIFTGEDERFAYKRARSRLWEMCGDRWWSRGREDGDGASENWWRPMPQTARAWEGSLVDEVDREAAAVPASGEKRAEAREGLIRDGEVEVEGEGLFRHGASPFRTSTEPPPQIHWTHAWGMTAWGKKAGAWGKGVEGLQERREGKGEEVEVEAETEPGQNRSDSNGSTSPKGGG